MQKINKRILNGYKTIKFFNLILIIFYREDLMLVMYFMLDVEIHNYKIICIKRALKI